MGRFGRTGEIQYWSRASAGPRERRRVTIPHQLYVSIGRDRYSRSDIVNALRDVHDGAIAVLCGSIVDHRLDGRSVGSYRHFEDLAVKVGLDAWECWFRRTDGTRIDDCCVNLRDSSRCGNDNVGISCPMLVLDRTWHRKSVAQRYQIEALNDRPARYVRK